MNDYVHAEKVFPFLQKLHLKKAGEKLKLKNWSNISHVHVFAHY